MSKIVRSFASKAAAQLSVPNFPPFISVFKRFGLKMVSVASARMRFDASTALDSVYFDSRTAQFAPKPEIATDTFHRHNELNLLCTELDRQGNSSLRKGLFSKTSLCSSLGLQARDLRKLDGTLKNQLPSILIRPSAILINLEFVRAVIKCDRVIFFTNQHQIESDLFQAASSPNNSQQAQIPSSIDTTRQESLARELAGRLKACRSSAPLPYEFIALEGILQTTLQALQDEFDGMAPSIEEHLTILERFVHWDKLKIMLECKKRVALFHERISSVRNCLAEVLESDSDMAAMYLTAKSLKSQPRPVYAHEEIELLLESYLKIAEEISSRVQLLASNIQSTEDIVNIGLVGQRNELLLLELKLGIGTFSASMGGFGASVLGMNLINGLEGNQQAFWIILSGLLSVALFSFTSSWRKMLKLIRKY